MSTLQKNSLPTIGSAIAGGFYAGLISVNNDQFALIVSPKADGEFRDVIWNKSYEKINASSCFDGFSNTTAMAEAGSEIAQKIRVLNIQNFNDWYIPSRDELEILYRNLKPTEQKNYCSFRDGDNASSIPSGFPYTEENPAQTTAALFIKDGAQAFDTTWHWSSTQYSAGYAYSQDFGDGQQDWYYKDDKLAVRAVRRELII